MPAHAKPIYNEIARNSASCREPVLDWMDSHRKILGLWLDQLVEAGDPDDLISLVHRQESWLAMMQERMTGPHA